MSAQSSIEWTNATWNPVIGCEMVSPGCALCYAQVMAKRLRAMALADIAKGRNPGRKRHYIDAVTEDGRWSGKLIPVPEALSDPLGWRKPRTIFVNSMSDLFHEDVPFEFVDKVFAVMNATAYRLPLPHDPRKAKRWHTYQVLTKRSKWMAEYMLSRAGRFRQGEHPLFKVRGEVFRGRGGDLMNAAACLMWPPSNVWLGVSVENRASLERIMDLHDSPAAVRFISFEPLLEDLGSIRGYLEQLTGHGDPAWAIIGGESGPNARPCDVAWIRYLLKQCRDVGVVPFVKQLGANVVDSTITGQRAVASYGGWPDGTRFEAVADDERYLIPGRAKLRDNKGGDMAEWPEDLRIREMPDLQSAEVDA